MSTVDADRSETVILADWICGLRLDDIPDSAIRAAKTCIIDSLGCAIAGLHTRPCDIMLDLLSQHAGDAGVAIPATGRRLPVLKAAYVLAQAANALDFDDSFRAGAPSHPGATIIPPALAVAGWRDCSGADVLRAVIAGYEASLRIGRAIQPSPERDRQVFGFATWQTFGAMSAAAVLFGLDRAQILDAFGIAALHAPVPGGRKGGFGETGPIPWLKSNYGGASEAGIWASMLAERGYVGHRGILDGPSGFWIMASSDSYMREYVTEQLGSRWLIEQVGFKPYACCRWTHTMIDAIRECLPKLAGRTISAVTVAGFRELAEMGKGYPDSIIDAQFHAPYLAALELAAKPTDKGLFESDLDDDSLRALAGKVRLIHDPGADEAFYKEAALPVELTIRLDDGDVVTASRKFARGSARTGGFAQADLEAKFLLLTEPHIGAEKAGQVLEAIHGIESVDFREIYELLS